MIPLFGVDIDTLSDSGETNGIADPSSMGRSLMPLALGSIAPSVGDERCEAQFRELAMNSVGIFSGLNVPQDKG